MRRVGCLTLILVVSGLLGCGGDGPKTNSVSGKVTIGGKPAPKDTLVTFSPTDDNPESASGRVDDSGNYTLYTGASGTAGAVAGKYKVVLSEPQDESYMEGGGQGDPTAAAAKDGLVPTEYTSAATSPKEVEVTSGSNTIDIEI